MPILVVCPKCGAMLNAPDTSAGGQVRCPKFGCGALSDVPAFVDVVPVEDEVEESPRPRPKPAVAESDRLRKNRRDEDDEDDRPKKVRHARKRRWKPRRKPSFVATTIIGIIVVVAGIGVGIYFLLNSNGLSTGNTAPSGWKEYVYKEDGFKAYFPVPPIVERVSKGVWTQISGYESATIYGAGTTVKGSRVVATISVVRLKSGTPGNLDQVMATSLPHDGGAEVSDPRDVTWAGRKAKQITCDIDDGGKSGRIISRYVIVDKTLFVASIVAVDKGNLHAWEREGFFDSFELLK